ncbi:porin family protein [Flavobacterium gyeonganense]|uniref:Porin family protein n=1 Tax=Flavobacterium gyeonganense TaxID=1310418 RepID=A0ABV5H5A1_9FLAO|nr:porin family protein [Flavobacterium gyeonganense]
MSKKNLAFIAFSLFAFLKIQAQVTFKPGIHAGVNLSKISKTDFDVNSKTDFYFGGFGALKLSRFYTLQPEVTYSRQGAKASIEGFYYDRLPDGQSETITENRNVDISLRYLSFVTINKFNITEKVYLLAGPYIDFVIGDEIEYDKSNGFFTSVSKGEDIDFGIIGGAGFNLYKGIALEARIKKGTRDAFDDTNGAASINTNLVYQIGAAYTF